MNTGRKASCIRCADGEGEKAIDLGKNDAKKRNALRRVQRRATAELEYRPAVMEPQKDRKGVGDIAKRTATSQLCAKREKHLAVQLAAQLASARSGCEAATRRGPARPTARSLAGPPTTLVERFDTEFNPDS